MLFETNCIGTSSCPHIDVIAHYYTVVLLIFTACKQGSLFSSVCDFFWFFLFVPQISPEPLNGFAPNLHGRHVWSLTRTSLKVRVKDQGHQGQKRA